MITVQSNARQLIVLEENAQTDDLKSSRFLKNHGFNFKLSNFDHGNSPLRRQGFARTAVSSSQTFTITLSKVQILIFTSFIDTKGNYLKL